VLHPSCGAGKPWPRRRRRISCRGSDSPATDGLDELMELLNPNTEADVQIESPEPVMGTAQACRSGVTTLARNPVYERTATVGDSEDTWFEWPHGVVADSQGDVWMFDAGTDYGVALLR
jgi:hypothetical protein